MRETVSGNQFSAYPIVVQWKAAQLLEFVAE